MQREETTGAGEGHALLDQPRLSDPRVAHQRDDPGHAVRCGIERESESLHFGLPPHERYQMRRHGLRNLLLSPIIRRIWAWPADRFLERWLLSCE